MGKIKLPNSGKRFDRKRDGWISRFLVSEFGLMFNFGYAWKPENSKPVPLFTKYDWNSQYIGSSKQKLYRKKVSGKFFNLIELNKIKAFGTADATSEKYPINIDIDINGIDDIVLKNNLCNAIMDLIKLPMAYTCPSTNNRGTHNHIAIMMPDFRDLSLRQVEDKITDAILDFEIKVNKLVQQTFPKYAKNINIDIIGLPVRHYEPNHYNVKQFYRNSDETTPVIEHAGTLIKIPNEIFSDASARFEFENRQTITFEEFTNWFSQTNFVEVKKEKVVKEKSDILTAGSVETVAKWDLLETTKARFTKFFNSDKLSIQNRRSLSAEEAAEYCIIIEQSCRMNCKDGYYKNTQPIAKIKGIWEMNQKNGYITNNFNEKKLKVVLQILSGYGVIEWEDENWIAPTVNEETGEIITGRGRKFTFNAEAFLSFIETKATKEETSIVDTTIEAFGDYLYFEFPFFTNFEKMMSGRPLNLYLEPPNLTSETILKEFCV